MAPSKTVASKALGWVAENVGNSAVGKVIDWALGKIPNEESEADKHTKRSKQAQDSLSGVQASAETALGRQKILLDYQTSSITKLQASLDEQNGNLSNVWSEVNSAASKMERQEISLDKIEWSFQRLSAGVQSDLEDFRSELHQLDDMQQTVKSQVSTR